jgi:hypothetical protein
VKELIARMRALLTRVLPSPIILTMLAAPAASSTTNSVAVLTHHNDLARTGANLQETELNTQNVNSNQFGLICTRTVDDEIYAQPLIMTNAAVPGKGRHNLVLVATVNDSVYAFDADDFSVREPYWHVGFLTPGIVPPRNTDMTGACDGKYVDFSGNIGIKAENSKPTEPVKPSRA